MRRRFPIGFRGVVTVVPAVLLVGLIAALGRGQESSKEKNAPAVPAISDAEKLVQEQVEAYNRHDLEAFLKTYSAEVKLYTFPDKELSSGVEQMRETYGNLFKKNPELKVKIAGRIVQGDTIIDQEELSGIPNPFTAVAIYRVKDGKIATVWFLR
jgi:hypothetical protein